MTNAILLDTREEVRWRPVAHVDKWDQDQTEWVAERMQRRLSERAAHLLLGRDLRSPQAAQFVKLGVKPYEEAESIGNLLTTAGLTRLMSLLVAGGGQALTNTSTRLGVGDGSGTAAVGDTDLSASAGATHRQFYVMDATFPSVAAGVLTAKSTFATGDANFAWNEWGLDVGAPTVANGTTVAALLFNHKTSAALGTKTTGSWSLTVTVTIS